MLSLTNLQAPLFLSYTCISPLRHPTSSSSSRYCHRNAVNLLTNSISCTRRPKQFQLCVHGFEDLDFGDDDADFDEVEEDYDASSSPLEWMEKWAEKKPSGFGEGKVYDTSIEEKLLQEIEQINLDTRASVSIKPLTDKKVPEIIPSGVVRVRVGNLPKKKNIKKDLKSAFKDIRGMKNITPAVSGNKKTRDPVCKGFAFVDFISSADAARFVDSFSGQSIAFGKIQKQIKCETITTSSHTEPAGPKPVFPSLKVKPDIMYDVDDSSFDSSMITESVESDEPVDEEVDDSQGHVEFVTVSEVASVDKLKPVIQKTSSSSSSPSSNQLDYIKVLEKKILARGKSEEVNDEEGKKENHAAQKKLILNNKVKKVMVSATGGAAKRLKIKDKAVLSNVMSRYGVKPVLAAKELNSS